MSSPTSGRRSIRRSTTDARASSTRGRAFAASWVMLRCILAGLVSMAGCERFPFDWQPAEPASQAEAPQCVRDDDCALLPSALTCCVECPPAPPFEAVPTAVIAGLLIENETVCAEPKLCP